MEMISTLSDALEQEYGVLVTRLYRVFKPAKGPFVQPGSHQMSVALYPVFASTNLVRFVRLRTLKLCAPSQGSLQKIVIGV